VRRSSLLAALARVIARTGLALVVALLLVPEATARPVATIVSKRYAYSLALPGSPSRWLSHLATANWTSAFIGRANSPDLDTFSDTQSGRFYLIAAGPTTSHLQGWTMHVISARPSPPCGQPHMLPNSTLGGAAARIATWSCTDGYKVFVTTALHAHRGYMMLLASPTTLSASADLHAFDAARRSLHFLQR